VDLQQGALEWLQGIESPYIGYWQGKGINTTVPGILACIRMQFAIDIPAISSHRTDIYGVQLRSFKLRGSPTVAFVIITMYIHIA